MAHEQPATRDILLRTKISIPRIPAEFVPRPILTARIERGAQGPLTLLAAPAGFGKTNLLTEWAQTTHLPVAWLTLDAADNDPSRLFRYIIGALQTLAPTLGDGALDLLQSSQSNEAASSAQPGALTGSVELGLTLLINDIAAIPQEIALVLDDFQVIQDPTLLQSARFFLWHLPANLHLIIASRSQPGLDLGPMRAKGRLLEIDADDLRFTKQEVGKFFDQALHVQLPERVLETVEQRTEGWVTALQMAALSVGNHPDAVALLANLEGDAHYLVDYLAEEVLDRQPEEIRQFLLRSSVLNTLSGPLCEAVVNPQAQPGYGTAMLNRLENARLFITALDEKHELFRYHNLFADFLRHIYAEINPSEIPTLQKRAAAWYENNGNLEEGVPYALASGDVEWAADLIQRNVQTIIQSGEIISLTHWIGQLPEPVIRQRPSLSLPYAWGLIAEYRLDFAHYWLDNVQSRLHDLEQPVGGEAFASDSTETASAFSSLADVRGGLAICQSTLAILDGDMEQAAAYSRLATEYLHAENPFVQSLVALDDSLYHILSGDTQKAVEALRHTTRIARQANNLLVAVVANCQLADILVMQGQLDQAWATLQKARIFTLRPDGSPHPLNGVVDIGFGEILLERGSIEKAHTLLEEGYQSSQNLWSISRIDGMISLARLRQAEGNVASAKAILDDASRIAFSTESSQWDDNLISAVAARMALLRGDLAEAEQWWARGKLPNPAGTLSLEDYPYHVFEYLGLTQARLLLGRAHASGRAAELEHARDILNTLMVGAEPFQRVTSKIEILILQACLEEARGAQRASEALLQALALGEPQGYAQIFIDEGWQLAPLLRQCQSQRRASGEYLPSLAYIERILASLARNPRPAAHAPVAGHEPTASQFPADELPVALSVREIEVLQLIAAGKSNQEISAELYLALNTVKRHAYNIFSKLEVKNRTQAVTRARQLGLIA